MKHFKIIGEHTTREFDIEDDEMVMWNILKASDYEKIIPNGKLDPFLKQMQNEKSYPTKKEDLI